MTAARKLQPSTNHQPQSNQQWNKRILVVDDEPAVVQSYKDILLTSNQAPASQSSRSSRTASVAPLSIRSVPNAEAEFTVTVAYSGSEALRLVHQAIEKGEPFTMGFFDVLLGGEMDGIELVKHIHNLDPHLHAIFVTAYNDRNVDSIAQVLGGDRGANWDYLNKPFTHGEILQKARNGISAWNLRHEKDLRDDYIANLQKQLMESEKISSVAAVSRGVAHEFGNILTQIIGRAELSQNLPEKGLREAIGDILKASMRASQVLSRFQNLAKSGQASSPHQWFMLHQPVEEAIEILTHQLKSNNVKVCWLKKGKISVLGDQTALFQVAVNLIINAIHAMPGSGQIDVTVDQNLEFAELRVRDYGTGVDPQILPKITEPFFTTKGEAGTGLGLAICRNIVEIEHQGEIQIRNHETKGLEVIVRIPLVEEGGVKNA